MKAKLQPANLHLERDLAELGLEFRKEWQFAHPRRWRLDYVLGVFADSQHWEPNFTAIEIEGGIWTRGRHTRGAGYQADLEKYNTATMMGYRILRFSTEDVLRGRAKAFLAEWLSAESKGAGK
jgi:hypothetical protein